MYSTAIENGQLSTLNSRAAVDRARALLDTALSTTGEEIRVVAGQFERLAREVQSVLDLTAGIVECVQQDWMEAIVPKARALASSARQFIETRVESLEAIKAVFVGEAGMLENLLSLTTEQRSIAREGKTLGVLASIEVARLAAAGKRFEYMARELDEFSEMVSNGATEVRTEAELRRTTLIDRQRILNLTIERSTSHFNIAERELSGAIIAMDSALAGFALIPAEFQACVSLIAGNISRVVEAVQVQDITRQQTEHVRELLIKTAGELEGGSGPVDRSARHNAILKVQALQVQSACTNTRKWIDEINQCLESILRIGSSDVLATSTTILNQQHALSLQLERIKQLEQECAADDAVIDASLAGIGELMRIAKNHLGRSRQARDRMRLLNFNSMIEARNLGSQATAVLEITRNIGRISTVWSVLTDRSGDTLEAMLNSSARAEEMHRTKTRLGMENLTDARHESSAGLEALSHASAVADESGGKVRAAVTAMHDQSTKLRRIAGNLTESVVLMQEAQGEIQSASRQIAHGAASLTIDDRRQIEDECAALYSSEFERNVLRAALDGEEISVQVTPITGNDVELF